jgi:hypothetical protein
MRERERREGAGAERERTAKAERVALRERAIRETGAATRAGARARVEVVRGWEEVGVLEMVERAGAGDAWGSNVRS